MYDSAHIAVDLGASGGRVALGIIEDGVLKVEIAHRFANIPLRIPNEPKDHIAWDIKSLWREIQTGINHAAKIAAAKSIRVDSIGIDSWAVDYAMLDRYDNIIGHVRHYRDARTEGMEDILATRVSRQEVYKTTGIQFLPFNTLFQLMAHALEDPQAVADARAMLMIPDLFHYWLSGIKGCERTNASTTQFYDPSIGDWTSKFNSWIGVRPGFLPQILEAGTRLGPLKPELAQQFGLPDCQVILPATHDTAAAVAVVPALGDNWAYISSGTWSLVGIETDKIFANDTSFAANFTNEAGINGTNRFLKNVMGLWILQECRRVWGDLDYADIYAQAQAAPPFLAMINPDDLRFLGHGADMPQRIQAACKENRQKVPTTVGEISRVILESLANKYRRILGQITQITGQSIETIHIVGGGSQIGLLNQMVADATGLPVVSGPIDASLVGNLLTQAQGLGTLKPQDRRQMVAKSFQLTTTLPVDHAKWHPKAAAFDQLIETWNLG